MSSRAARLARLARLKAGRRRVQSSENEDEVEKNDINTLVFTWVQSKDVLNKPPTYSWGIGDLIRGMIAIFQYAKINRCNFYVNRSMHPIHTFFKPPNTDYLRENNKEAVTFYGVDGGKLNTFKPTFDDTKECNLVTNVWPTVPLTHDEKSLVRSFLEIKEEYKIELPSSYNVLHFRTGDTNMSKINGTFEPFSSMIKKYSSEGDIVITDCPGLKRHVQEQFPLLHVFNQDSDPNHSGYDTDHEKLKSTIVDLQIIQQAKKVYTYSVYNWISGFVHWCCLCYGIEIISLKNK